MTVLALTTKVGDSVKLTDDEVTIAKTRTFNLSDNHLIKVTTCWRSTPLLLSRQRLSQPEPVREL